MAESQVPFAYDEATFRQLSGTLTTQRLGTYLKRASFDHAWAMDFYLWNARLSKALQFPIHVAEVTLRNAVSEHLRLVAGVEDWAFDRPFLGALARGNPEALASIDKAKERLLREPARANGGTLTTDDIIAKLSFEFWVAMLDGRYEVEWQRSVRTVFRNLAPHESRKTLRAIAIEVSHLRNRIAHHEPILNWSNLEDRHSEMIGLIRRRCLVTAKWVRDHSTFPRVWQEPPKSQRRPGGQLILGMAHKPVPVLSPSSTVAEAIQAMGGGRRGFGIIRLSGATALLTAGDLVRWIRASIEAGLVDVETPTLGSLDQEVFSTKLAFVGRDATTGETLALFHPKDTPGRMKPGAVVVTTTGDEAGDPLGIVFRPDVRQGA